MKRWRTDAARRELAAAALALLLGGIAGWPRCRCDAESPVAAARQLFARGPRRVGDYIRNEIATGKIPGAILLIQQHGKPVYFENFGVRDVATKLPMTRGHDLSPVFDVEADHVGRGDDAGGGRQASLDDPVAKYIPAFADVKVGVEKPTAEAPLLLEPLERPITIKDLLRHTSGLTYGYLWRRLGAKALCAGRSVRRATRQCRIRRRESPNCRWPNSRERGGTTAIPPTCSVASIEVVSGKSLLQFEKERLLDPLGMSETAFFVADQAKRPRIAEPMPEDRVISPTTIVRDPMQPRRHWNPAAAAWSAPSATTRALRRCC